MFSGGGATWRKYSGGVVCAAAITAVPRYLLLCTKAKVAKPAVTSIVEAIRMNLRRRNASSSENIDKEFPGVVVAINYPPSSAGGCHDRLEPHNAHLR